MTTLQTLQAARRREYDNWTEGSAVRIVAFNLAIDTLLEIDTCIEVDRQRLLEFRNKDYA